MSVAAGERRELVGVKTLYIAPESPWENGYLESFNGKVQDELMAREVFGILLEASGRVGFQGRHGADHVSGEGSSSKG